MNFQYYLPVHLLFGQNTFQQLGKEVKKYGSRVLLVTGSKSTKETGVLDRAIALLKEEQLEVVVFDKVSQNPTTTVAYEGCALAKEQQCQVVLGLGGGSIMDCAKAIAFLFYNPGDIFDYIYGNLQGDQSLPLVLVPTTCGTGSEGNCFAVLTDPRNNDKKSLRNMSSIAKTSIVDPCLMTTMPKSLLATVGFDALCHNIEAYLSKYTQPLVEIQSIYAIQLILESLPVLYQGKGTITDYEKLTFASTLGGMGINMAGVTAAHGMEHPASGLKNVTHGSGLAALSTVIYEESLESAPEKFTMLAVLFGGKTKEEFPELLKKLLVTLEIETSLKKLGIQETDVDWMTENCFKVSVAAMNAHPRLFTREEVRELYRKAL